MADAVFELAIRGTWNTKPVANVFHVKGDELGDGLGTIAQELVDAIYRDNPTWYDNGFNLATYHARMISTNPTLFEGPLVTPFTGGSASTPLSNQTALVVTTRTGYAGRRKRGRHYLPGLVSTMLLQDGSWSTTVLTTLATAFSTLISSMPIGTGAYTWGVWSAKNGETRDGAGNLISVNMALGFTPITTVTVRSIPAVQRRRRIGT